MFSLVAVSAELAEHLVAIESDAPDSVHQARVRVRRLRSVLGVHRRAFDADEAARLRRRLAALGGRLGTVRDLEVRAHAIAALAAPGGTAEPADRETVDALLAFASDAAAAHSAATARLVASLHGRAHRQLLADLVLFAASPPLSPRGRDHPRRTARKAIAEAGTRATRRRGDALDERHATRKAARRLRYAAEAVADTFGRDAVRIAVAAEDLQTVLGDHRDLVLLAVWLRAKAEDAGLSPAAAAGIERVAAECEARAEEAVEGVDGRLAALRRILGDEPLVASGDGRPTADDQLPTTSNRGPDGWA